MQVDGTPEIKLLPNPGQAVGPTGAQISPQISKIMIDAVKSGDTDRFSLEFLKYKIEVRDIKDPGQFNQNLCCSAVQGTDEEKCIKMLELVCKLGVDVHQKDDLKQTPLFYALKNGYLRIIRLLVQNGVNINDIDVYG